MCIMFFLRTFQIFCLITSATVMTPGYVCARAETEIANATHHIQNFGNKLIELLKKDGSLEKFKKLIRSTFDLPHLAKQCCPVKYDRLSSEQRSLYEKKFEEKICHEYFSLLRKYYKPKDSENDHFKIDNTKSKQYPCGSGVCASICTIVFAPNGAPLYIMWVVQGNKIKNFVVEGTDMRAAEKRGLKTRYKQAGSDMKKFLDTLNTSNPSS